MPELIDRQAAIQSIKTIIAPNASVICAARANTVSVLTFWKTRLQSKQSRCGTGVGF